MVRFCPTCNAEVAETGGFCLLGHPVGRTPAPTGSLKELRDEVEKAFEDARVQVAAAMAPVVDRLEAGASKETSNGAFHAPPPPPPRRTPPPPPPPQVFDSLRADEPRAADPIAAFAPSPRMDWGPSEKSNRRRRRS